MKERKEVFMAIESKVVDEAGATFARPKSKASAGLAIRI